MSLGDAIRGLIDPLHPAVRSWLQRELPRLVREGYLDEAQANLIARRYGVRLVGGAAAEAPTSTLHHAPASTAEVDAEPPASAETTTTAAPGPSIGAPGTPIRAAGAPVGAPGRPASPFLADHAVSIVLYLGA